MWMVVVIGTFAVLPPGVVSAQEFDCGSNGSDGALDFVTGSTDPVTIEFDPTSFDPPLDQDREGGVSLHHHHRSGECQREVAGRQGGLDPDLPVGEGRGLKHNRSIVKWEG
jgi:hypothetical protein